MHYKNGRPAKEGDRVILIKRHAAPLVGILHSTVPDATSCNGRLAPISAADPFVNLNECLHIDDIAQAVIPNSLSIGEG